MKEQARVGRHCEPFGVTADGTNQIGKKLHGGSVRVLLFSLPQWILCPTFTFAWATMVVVTTLVVKAVVV